MGFEVLPSNDVVSQTDFSSFASSVQPPAMTQPTFISGTPTMSVAPTPTGSQLTKQVSIIDFAFQPQSITIPVGTTVTWTNTSLTIPHTVTSDTGVFSSPTINPGQTYSFTFNQAGTYTYHCTIHPGMTGTVVVLPAGVTPTATPAPTIAPTNTPLPTPTGIVPGCTPNALPGDINGDCKVDLTDFSILAANYGLCTTALKNVNADIDHSGCVDLTDFSKLAKDYGLSTPTPTP